MRIIGIILIAAITLTACKKNPPTQDPPDNNPPTSATDAFPVELVQTINTELKSYFTSGDKPSEGLTKIYNDYIGNEDVDDIEMVDACMMIRFKNGTEYGISCVWDSSGFVKTAGGLGEPASNKLIQLNQPKKTT